MPLTRCDERHRPPNRALLLSREHDHARRTERASPSRAKEPPGRRRCRRRSCRRTLWIAPSPRPWRQKRRRGRPLAVHAPSSHGEVVIAPHHLQQCRPRRRRCCSCACSRHDRRRAIWCRIAGAEGSRPRVGGRDSWRSQARARSMSRWTSGGVGCLLVVRARASHRRLAEFAFDLGGRRFR
jgi:hypothetical protein